jgi:hypothetical protein
MVVTAAEPLGRPWNLPRSAQEKGMRGAFVGEGGGSGGGSGSRARRVEEVWRKASAQRRSGRWSHHSFVWGSQKQEAADRDGDELGLVLQRRGEKGSDPM